MVCALESRPSSRMLTRLPNSGLGVIPLKCEKSRKEGRVNHSALLVAFPIGGEKRPVVANGTAQGNAVLPSRKEGVQIFGIAIESGIGR